MKSSLINLAQRLHRDERGDIPVGQIAVIGLIVVPLVLTLILFRVEIATFLIDQWVVLMSAPSDGDF